MQTLARVNRTFRGKPDGLLVAYAPLAENLEKALAEYTETGRPSPSAGTSMRPRWRPGGWSSSSTRSARDSAGGPS